MEHTFHEILKKLSGDKEDRGFLFTKAFMVLIGGHYKPNNSRLQLSLFCFLQCVTHFLVIAGIFWLSDASMETDDDFVEYIRNIVLLMVVYFGNVKYCFIFFNRYRMKDIIEGLEELSRNIKSLKPLNVKHQQKAFKANVFYCVCVVINGITWMVYPVLFEGGKLPINVHYPWKTNSIRGFFGGYSIQILSTAYIALGHITLDTFLPSATGVMRSQLQLLKEELETLGSPNQHPRLLLIAVDFHNYILKYVNLLKKLTGTLLMAQIFYIISHACMIIFLIVNVNDLGALIVNAAPILLAAYTQLGLYCYFGQELSQGFEDLLKSLHNNQWYNCSKSDKQNLRIMTEFMKMPVALTGGGNVFVASHETFLHSLQESISYYLFLKTMTTKEQ